MAKILVTGALGFIGSNLVEKLVQNGHQVTAVDNLRAGKIDFLSQETRGRVHEIRITDFANPRLLQLVASKTYDYIVHLAAIPRIGYSIANPMETHETNVTATLNLITAAVGNVKRFVFASSSSVYGDNQLPLHESLPKHTVSPYALQKSIIEDYLKLHYDLYGLDSVCLRFFSVFGKNSLGTSAYATVISAWLTAILQGKPIKVFGTGKQQRDFCHVDNIIDAILRALDHEKQLKASCVNVACGQMYSLLDIIDYLEQAGFSFEKQFLDQRQADIKDTLADITAAKDLLGYKPLVSFEEGLTQTIKWYQNNWNKICLL